MRKLDLITMSNFFYNAIGFVVYSFDFLWMQCKAFGSNLGSPGLHPGVVEYLTSSDYDRKNQAKDQYVKNAAHISDAKCTPWIVLLNSISKKWNSYLRFSLCWRVSIIIRTYNYLRRAWRCLVLVAFASLFPPFSFKTFECTVLSQLQHGQIDRFSESGTNLECFCIGYTMPRI